MKPRSSRVTLLCGFFISAIMLIYFQNCGGLRVADPASKSSVSPDSTATSVGSADHNCVAVLLRGDVCVAADECSVAVANQQPLYAAVLDPGHLPPGCGWVQVAPISPNGANSIRCDATSPYSDIRYGASCRQPLSSHALFSNGEVGSVSAFNNLNALQLSVNLQTQINQWWVNVNSPTGDTGTKDSIRTLLASAYDQICRDSLKRKANDTCQFPFPELQNSRFMALGQACPLGDVLQSTTLFTNGTIAARNVLGGSDHLNLAMNLTSQLAEWARQSNGTRALQGNLHLLRQLGYDQICRCGGACEMPFPDLSRQTGGGASWMSSAELAAPDNLLSDQGVNFGDFSAWPDGTDFTTSVGQGMYTAKTWWVAGGGPGAVVHITQGAIAPTDLPGAAGYEHSLVANWLSAATMGETQTSPRTTFFEHHGLEFQSNTDYFANEVVLLTFYVRSTQDVAIIPIMWQAFGGTSVPAVAIYSGKTVTATSEWQIVQQFFRMPSTRKTNPQGYAEATLGLDFQNVIGFTGQIELAGFSVTRTTPDP